MFVGMKPCAYVLLALCTAGPGFSAAQEQPVLAQEFKPEGVRPGFWWTRRVDEYTLQFFGAMAAPRSNTMAIVQPVPVPAPRPDPGAATNRASFFIGNTIANLRGLDPSFGCRTLTLIDGRRVNQGNATAATRESPPPPPPVPRPTATGLVGIPQMQVWLLNRDGTIVMPQRKLQADGKYCDTGIVYGFESAAAGDAMAVAFTDGEHYYVQKLQPFADEQD